VEAIRIGKQNRQMDLAFGPRNRCCRALRFGPPERFITSTGVRLRRLFVEGVLVQPHAAITSSEQMVPNTIGIRLLQAERRKPRRGLPGFCVGLVQVHKSLRQFPTTFAVSGIAINFAIRARV
jgi:hypothetical protein